MEIPADIKPFGQEAPTGTVTFLFTDIEGSTKLLERLRDQYAVLLDEQRQILRSAFARWNGREIDTQGDSFFTVFPRAIDAVCCVMEVQRELTAHEWPQKAAVRVRMGLHTGEPIQVRSGYIGMDVHRAARIAAAGYGGQVLVSQTTRDLVYQDLPKGTVLRDLGEHKLKDIRFPQQIYQLEIEGLQVEFPTLKTLSTVEEPPTPGEAPYKGLQYFDEADAAWFFGREKVSSQLACAVQEQHFLAVIGASGSGKSSIIRAGLVPELKRNQPGKWQVHLFTPSNHPLESLAVSLTRQELSVASAAALIDDLRNDARSLHLFLRRTIPKDSQTEVLLVVDQLEELFTQCRDETERQAFVENLLYAAQAESSPMRVVVALRADFYQHLSQYSGLRTEVAKHQEYLGSMGAAELRQAIEEPAHRGGWEFSPGLVDLMLHDIGASEGHQPEPGALPLLSHALLETWKRRRANLMSLRAYSESGGVRGAIAKTAESIYFGELTLEQQLIARNIFLRLTELGEGAQDTRRRTAISELIPPAPYGDPKRVEEVLVKLADARLITTGEGYAEVAHEALIREWPTLREWLSEDREGLRVHRHMTEAAREWELLEQDPEALYRGARLAQALEWSETNIHQLNALEKAFLEASQEAVNREQAERETQRQRELEAAQTLAATQATAARRLRRRAFYLLGALVVSVLLAAAAMFFGQQSKQNALLAQQNLATAQSESQRAEVEANTRATAEAKAIRERQNAEEQAHLAFSRELAAAALNSISDDQELAVLLALQALKQADTWEAEEALHRTVQELRIVRTLERPGNWIGLDWSSDGSYLAASGKTGAAVWDPDNGKLLYSKEITEGMINRLAFSPDGSLLVLPSEGGDPTQKSNVSILDANTGQELLTFPAHDAYVQHASFSLDGTRFATASGDGTAKVWDLAKTLASGAGQSILTVSFGEESFPWAAWFSPDGAHLATANADLKIHYIDARSGRDLWQAPTDAYDLSFSPDGSRMVASGSLGMLDVLESSTGKRLSRTLGHTLTIRTIVFNRDGSRLATSCKDGTVKIWAFSEDALSPLFTLSGHKDQSNGLAFSPDGKKLASESSDGTVRIWDISPKGSVEPIVYQHLASVQSVAISPDGSELVTGAMDGRAIIWDILSGRSLHTLSRQDWIWRVTYNLEGDLLATASRDATLMLWNPATGSEVSTLSGHEQRPDSYFFKGVIAAAFSPDGRRLATAGGDGAVHVWDVAALRKADLGMGDELLSLADAGELNFATDVAFSPDGRWIAATLGNYGFIPGNWENGMIKVWDAATNQLVWTINTPEPPYIYITVSFSPDGRRLAAGDLKGQATVWKLPDDRNGNLEQLFTIKAGKFFVMKLNFSPDGAQLAIPYSEGMGIWDANSGELIATLPHPGTTFEAVFSPDGSRLATAGADGFGRLFFLDIDELVAMAKTRLTRTLTTEECQQYLHLTECPDL